MEKHLSSVEDKTDFESLTYGVIDDEISTIAANWCKRNADWLLNGGRCLDNEPIKSVVEYSLTLEEHYREIGKPELIGSREYFNKIDEFLFLVSKAMDSQEDKL